MDSVTDVSLEAMIPGITMVELTSLANLAGRLLPDSRSPWMFSKAAGFICLHRELTCFLG